jgi:hypothetical protein
MKRMPTPLFARTLFACASLVAAPALAQNFSCPEIKAALAEADGDFAALKGRQLKKETAEDYARANGLPAGKPGLQFQRMVYEAKKPLSGPVTACQVVDVAIEVNQSTVRQSVFECLYEPKSSAARISPAIRKQLHGCVGGEVDPDSDNEGLIIYVNRVASGEGTRGVLVELETNPADGAKLSIRKTVCLKKAPAGCDDE